jgi:hypothetical protein
LGKSLSAKFAKSMVATLTGSATLRTAALRLRILRPGRRRLLPARHAGLRRVLRELSLLRPVAGLRALLRPRPTLSKPLSGFHAERALETRLFAGLRSAALLSLRTRSALILWAARQRRTAHPLARSAGHQIVAG